MTNMEFLTIYFSPNHRFGAKPIVLPTTKRSQLIRLATKDAAAGITGAPIIFTI